MSNRGRKRDSCWLEVAEKPDPSEPGKKNFFCKSCDERVSGRSERIRSHLQRCRKYKKLALKSSRGSASDSKKDEEAVPATAANANRIKQGTSQMQLDNFVVKTTENTKKELDTLVAKFIFKNRIAVAAANSASYQSLLKMLRPGYSPPSASQLAALRKSSK